MTITNFIRISVGVVGLTAFAATAQAASFEVGFQATIGSEGNALALREDNRSSEGGPYYVSVHPNNPGYAAFAANLPNSSDPADAFQRPFIDPVRAWTWVGGGANGVLTQDVRTDGSGLISYATNSTTFDGFAQDQLTLWTTNDPGPDLLNPVTERNVKGPGYRGGFVDVTATIDISGLALGTVYVFYGDFRGKPTLSAVMRDTNGTAPDIIIENAHLNDDSANRAEYYVAELNFVSDGAYDEIEYIWNGNGDGGTNGRFGGTVLTGSDSPPVAFVITEIVHDSDNDMVRLSWNAEPSTLYTVYYAQNPDKLQAGEFGDGDLGDSFEDNDAGDTDLEPEEGKITIEVAYPDPDMDVLDLFFSVHKNL